jgi:hypothetical protein
MTDGTTLNKQLLSSGGLWQGNTPNRCAHFRYDRPTQLSTHSKGKMKSIQEGHSTHGGGFPFPAPSPLTTPLTSLACTSGSRPTPTVYPQQTYCHLQQEARQPNDNKMKRDSSDNQVILPGAAQPSSMARFQAPELLYWHGIHTES